MKKHEALRADVGVTFAHAMSKVPISWTGNVSIKFEPGTYDIASPAGDNG